MMNHVPYTMKLFQKIYDIDFCFNKSCMTVIFQNSSTIKIIFTIHIFLLQKSLYLGFIYFFPQKKIFTALIFLKKFFFFLKDFLKKLYTVKMTFNIIHFQKIGTLKINFTIHIEFSKIGKSQDKILIQNLRPVVLR